MTRERWRIVTGIFHAALEQPSLDRPAFLSAACGADRTLRDDVDAMLAGDARSETFGDPLTFARTALLPGTLVGPYRIDGLLDEGGMGAVYRARDTRLRRDVAIKVLPADLSADPDRVARFEREAHAAAALNHPNICAVFDTGTHDGAPFIVSELLEGDTLRRVCAAGPLSLRRALDLAVPIARGLAAAHAKGIVHRDVKPENVFITTDGQVKILDFGVAKLTEAPADPGPPVPLASPLTEVGVIVGTIAYMAPEQVRGLATDSRSDIFSFGTVLFEMLSGQRPFRGETAADTSSAILREDPPPLPDASVPPALDRIVRRCLEKSAPNRFQSAEDLAFALEAVQADAPSRAATRARVPKVRRRSPLALVALVASALVLGIVGWIAWNLAPRAVDPGAYRFTPFATGAGAADNGAWSPDGRSIAYERSVHGRSQIFVRSLDSDSAAQLTDAPFDAERPFWWPDGSRVGYVSGWRVWSVSRAGGAPERLQRQLVFAATLSPDGQTLAMWRTEPGRHTFGVWLASPPNAAPREYAPAPFTVKGWFTPTYLQFSPDGHRLLLSDWDDAGDAPIWLLPFPDHGAQPRRLAPDIPGLTPTLEPMQPAWMPDSQHAVMVFRTSSAPKRGLWLTDVLTGAAAPLAVAVTAHSSPSVSPDGSRMVFTAGGPGYDLVEVPLDGSPMRDFLATSEDEYSAAWVPRTSTYVYLTNKNGEEELRIHSQTDDWDRLIVASRRFGPASTLSSPVASPDGQRVAFDVWSAGGVSAIWVSPIGGGAPTRVSAAGATERTPAWSPDGQSIVCSHEQRGVVGLALLRVGSPDPARILAGAIAGVIPAWSSDGQWIAYQTDEAVRLISPDGKRERTLAPANMALDSNRSGWDSALVWSRDNRTLYSIRRTGEGVAQLVAIDAASGALHVVTGLGADGYFAALSDPGLRFTLAPDGRSFLASIVRTRTSLWILDGFAPQPHGGAPAAADLARRLVRWLRSPRL